jgi:2-(1,2-epoxy-1,2-dihydrophenyl)acetyl-CoA isomerase
VAAFETLQVETADYVCTITLNRPESLNSINDAMSTELLKVIRQLQREGGARCLVITGAGRAFSSGQDLGDLKKRYADPQFTPQLGDDIKKRYNPIILGLRDLEMPVIAAINGVAAGAGCSLALACDLRIASDKAKLIEVFVNVGLVPDSGSTFFLPRLVSLCKALELCFTGDPISAADALTLGLVNQVVPTEELPKVTRDLALRLAKMPTKAIALTKRLLYRSLSSDLETMLDAEGFAQQTAGQSADHREGVLAFFEKRAANFQGK